MFINMALMIAAGGAATIVLLYLVFWIIGLMDRRRR
jgi:hypothetical protein